MPSSSPTSLLPSHLLELSSFNATSTSRFQSLYSDFTRQRSSNPTSYQANVLWWRRAFEDLTLSGAQSASSSTDSNRFTLNANREILDRLRIEKIGKPIGLSSVITELCQSGYLIPHSVFLSSTQSIYSTGSLASRFASMFIGRPLWWALEQSGIVGEDSYVSAAKGIFTSSSSSKEDWFGCYVVVSLLEQAADQALRMHSDSAHDTLYSPEEFRNKFSSVAHRNETLREDEAKLLVKFLERDRGRVVSDGKVIKFIDDAMALENKTITAIDHGVIELRTAVSNMHKQVEMLQAKCDECMQKAKTALGRAQKNVAQSHLRTKKQTEGLLNKRLGALDTLEATLISVEGARGDVEIMRTYQSSTATLRAILSHPVLNADTIDDTMQALAAANMEAKEIDDTIRDVGSISTGVADVPPDDEIEKELESLIAEQIGEKKKQQPQHPDEDTVLSNMPNAPLSIPTHDQVEGKTVALEEGVAA